jgi:hypothetical protein
LFLSIYLPIVYKFGTNKYEKDLVLSVLGKLKF